MGELEQIKTQIDLVALPPTKARSKMTAAQIDLSLTKQAKELQKQIKR